MSRSYFTMKRLSGRNWWGKFHPVWELIRNSVLEPYITCEFNMKDLLTYFTVQTRERYSDYW